jgi:deoxyribodipyrimidine photo-lyase
MSKPAISIIWFRRDLRLEDNAALYYALRSGVAVVPLFIFDKNILDDLEDKQDRRITFIYKSLEEIQTALQQHSSSLEVYYGKPLHIYELLLEKYTIKAVYANEDYEQYAINRDKEISKLLQRHKGELKLYKDQVFFQKMKW